MRVFIAIQIPEQVKLCVGRIRESLRPSGADIKGWKMIITILP